MNLRSESSPSLRHRLKPHAVLLSSADTLLQDFINLFGDSNTCIRISWLNLHSSCPLEFGAEIITSVFLPKLKKLANEQCMSICHFLDTGKEFIGKRSGLGSIVLSHILSYVNYPHSTLNSVASKSV